MLPVSLVLVLIAAMAGDLSPEELINRLGSPDRVVREEAARSLEELGKKALPALHAAVGAAKEPEARARLSDLISRVHARLLDQPTSVSLDITNQPLSAAVQAVATRSGFSLTLDDPALAGRLVTVRSPGTLSFWAAVDRLSRAAHVRDDPGPHRDEFAGKLERPTIRLVAGDPPDFTSFSGPIRVHLLATHRHRDINFEAEGSSDAPGRSATVTVEMQAFVEPGRFLNANGHPRLEAIDERGRAISPQPAGASEHAQRGGNSWLFPGRVSMLHWQVPLGLPDPSIRSPLKLRGVLPVVITARAPDPFVVPLAGAVGKSFRQGSRTVRIERISEQGSPTTAIGLSVKESVIPPEYTHSSIGPETDYIGDFLADRIEFVNAEGQPLRWLLSNPRLPSTADDEIRIQTWVSSANPPARLLIHSLHCLATEIPFEFSNVPAP